MDDLEVKTLNCVKMTHIFAAQVVSYMLGVSMTHGGRIRSVAASSKQIQNAAIRKTKFILLLQFSVYKHFRVIFHIFNTIKRSNPWKTRDLTTLVWWFC